MNRGTGLFWLLVAVLGGASIFFGARVLERQTGKAPTAGGESAGQDQHEGPPGARAP